MTPLIIVAVVVAVVIIAVFALVAGKGQPEQAADFPYERRKFLTAAERSLFGVLEQAVQADYYIFAKVRVADLLSVKKGTEKRQGHQNRVTSKHIDFVLCDRTAMSPVLAIELDDSSHEAAERQKRDSFLDSAFAAAELPLLHVKARRWYDVSEVAKEIASVVNVSAARANTRG
jgi:very-short-patch-repair endonuclease